MTTDTPKNPAEQLDTCSNHIVELVQTSIDLMRVVYPNILPLAALSEVFRLVSDAMEEAEAPPPMVRSAMLLAFEQRHPQPMSFIDINKAKQAMVAMAAARRQADAASSGIIVPGVG
jgi:hypothetical protein